jgi:hypothetical protein
MVKPHRAAGFTLHGTADQLPGDLPLALAEHVIDRGADRGQSPRDLAFGRVREKSLRETLPR